MLFASIFTDNWELDAGDKLTNMARREIRNAGASRAGRGSSSPQTSRSFAADSVSFYRHD